jgi:hypothetical protein
MAELNHSFRLIEVVSRKKLGRTSAESVLRGNQDLAGILSTAREVEQAEQHARRPHAQEFVEVTRHAQVVVHSCDLGVAQCGHVGMARIDTRQRRFTPLEELAQKIRRRRRQCANDFSFSCQDSLIY